MGAKDRMHGSVTAANIAAGLKEATGEEIDKRKIDLAEPIKALGSYDIAIKLYKGIEPKIKLNVVAKDKEPEAVQEPEKKSE
jgi:large subunit ribosomal protein L9